MFVPVKDIDNGGEGVPIPVYRITYRGELIQTYAKGQAREALDWIKDKTHDFAVFANVDGTDREVARGCA